MEDEGPVTDFVPLGNHSSSCLIPLISPHASWSVQYVTELGDKESQPVLDDPLHNEICGEVAATVHELENATSLRFLWTNTAD